MTSRAEYTDTPPGIETSATRYSSRSLMTSRAEYTDTPPGIETSATRDSSRSLMTSRAEYTNTVNTAAMRSDVQTDDGTQLRKHGNRHTHRRITGRGQRGHRSSERLWINHHLCGMALHGNKWLLSTVWPLQKRHLALPKRHLAPSKTFR